MRIVKSNEEPRVLFEQIKIGGCFMKVDATDIYIKIFNAKGAGSGALCNCISLDSGYGGGQIDKEDKVIPVTAEVVVH